MELHIRDESLQQDGVVAKCQYSVGTASGSNNVRGGSREEEE